MSEGGVPSGCRAALLTISALAAWSCAGADRSEGGAGVETDTLGGRPVVRNPAEPAGSGGLELSRLWTREAPDRLSRIEAWEPEPEVRLRGARLFLSDPVADRVEVRDAADGSEEAVLDGRSGPDGSLDSLHAMAVSDSLVAVGDRNAIEVYRAGGGSAGRLEVSGRLLDLHGLDDGRFVARAYAGGVAWLRYGPGRDSAVARLPDLSAGSSARSEAGPGGCWNRDGTARGLLASSCTHAVLLEVDLRGRVEREIVRDVPPVESSSEELEAVRDQVDRQLEQAGREPTRSVRRALQDREARRHRLKKRFRAVREDPSTGRIAVLEQTPDYMGGGTATVHLFGPSGRYRAAASRDEEWIDFDFDAGRLVALRAGTDGSGPELVSYRVEIAGR